MKRTGRILSLVVVLVMLVSMLGVVAYADQAAGEGQLVLVESSPKDGGTDAAVENLGAKLYFESKFTDEVLGDKNDNKVHLYGPDGEELPSLVVYSGSEEGVVLVLLDTTAKDENGKALMASGDSDYKIVIEAEFCDDEGNTLGKETTIAFKTLNQKRSTTVYMIMTLIMFGGIAVFSMKGAKKKEEEAKEEILKEEKFNPYKEAKRSGKTVEEVIEEEKERRAKQDAKDAKKRAKEEALINEYLAQAEAEDEEYVEPGHYKVATRRTVAQGGSAYITGRKAEAERKAREAAERKEREAKWAQAAKKKKKGKK